MVRIVNCCETNLNYRNGVNELLGEDITTEIMVSTSPLVLLAAVNLNRKIIKLFTLQHSSNLTQLWVRHGGGISVNNAGFALPEKRLYTNTEQASRPLSVVTSTGTALIRLTVVNKL